MKKILLIVFILILNVQIISAKDYSLNFNGERYNLLYSAKNKEFGGYINEYFKRGETYNIWSEMIAVHHFPNAYSPIDRIKDFKDYLGSMNVPSSLTFDDKKNTATIDFIMISERNMPIIMEFNIFKYEKSKKCGSIAVQYVKRYSATNTLQIEQIKADFEKNRKKLIKKVQKLNIPEVIDKNIDKCISAIEIKSETDEEIKQEQEELAKKKEEELKLSEISENEKQAIQDKTDESEIIAKTEIQKKGASNEEDNISELNNNEEITKNTKISEAYKQSEEHIQNTESKTNKELVEKNSNEKLTDDNKNNIKAPVPAIEKITVNDKVDKQVSKKEKKLKYTSYEVTNNKEVYISQPRTKQELRAEVKENNLKYKQAKREAKQKFKTEIKQKKQAEKLAKKQAKIDKKNQKIAEKMAKKPYEITNTNADLKSKSRTKKELKKQTKQLKKQAKERAKNAKKALSK